MTVRSSTRRTTGDAGSALVEFGLVIPLFLALVVGLATSALAFLAQHQLSTAAQEGARVIYLEEDAGAATKATLAAAGSPAPTVTVNPSVSGTCSTGTTVTLIASRPAQIHLVFFPTIDVTITGRGVVRCQ